MTLVQKSAVGVLERTIKSAYRSVRLSSHPIPYYCDSISFKQRHACAAIQLWHILSHFTPTNDTNHAHSARFGVEVEAFVTTPGTGAGVVDLKKEEERKQLVAAMGKGGKGGVGGWIVPAVVGVAVLAAVVGAAVVVVGRQQRKG